MPHLIVQYSNNLEGKVDVNNLLLTLKNALDKHPEANIDINRVAARAYGTPYFIATAQFPDAFVNIELRLLKGRSVDLRKTLALTLQSTAREFLKNTDLKVCITAEPVELADGYSTSTNI